MSSSDALVEIWGVYQISLDSLYVASQSVETKEDSLGLLKNTLFMQISDEEALRRIDSGKSGIDDYLVLSLWTVFERQLYEYLQQESGRLAERGASSFSSSFRKKLEREIEYWRIDDILDDIFGAVLEKELIGSVKQIKKYRDWLVHRNPKKAFPGNITPQRAYDTLSDVLSCLRDHPDLSCATEETGVEACRKGD